MISCRKLIQWRIPHGAIRAGLLLVLLAASAGFAMPAHCSDTDDQWDGNWHGSITPYGWLPGVSAKMRYQLPGTNTDVQNKTDHNILSALSGAFMLSGDIRKGNWGLFTDVDWVKFSNEKGRFTSIGNNFIGGDASLNTSSNLKGGFVTLAGLYTLAHGQDGYIDLIFGGRYLWLKGNLGWNFAYAGDHFGLDDSGHLSSQTHVSDLLVGIRGRWIPGGGNWFVPYYLDIGGGSSDTTSQLAVGVGYAFHWGDIAFAWRYVSYKRSDADILQKLSLEGPSIGLTWHF